MREEHILYFNYDHCLFFQSFYVLLLPTVDNLKVLTRGIRQTQKRFYRKEKKPPDDKRGEMK